MVPVVHFWERYGRVALGVLAGLVVVGAIAFFFMRSRAAEEEVAAGKLAEASLFYWQGDYPRAMQLARETSGRHGATPSGLDAHRLAGDAAYWGGDFKTSIAEYRRYLGKNQSGLLADAARRSLAYSLESDKQFVEAAREYEALVGRFERSSSGEFLLAAARCYRGANQPDQVQARLQRLVDEFGETEASNQARVELAELQTARVGSATP